MLEQHASRCGTFIDVSVSNCNCRRVDPLGPTMRGKNTLMNNQISLMWLDYFVP